MAMAKTKTKIDKETEKENDDNKDEDTTNKRPETRKDKTDRSDQILFRHLKSFVTSGEESLTQRQDKTG
jgi:hypothetical protein